MDPNATLQRIIEAATNNDRQDYIAACRDLADWLASGGARPTLPATLRYIPGTGTPWSVLSPLTPTGTWHLVRWDWRGNYAEMIPLGVHA